MNKTYTTLLLSVLHLCIFCSDAKAKKVRALFLGNSYTQVNNLPELIKQLALSTGDTLEYSSNTPGGHTFQGHAGNPTSLSLIAAGGWDFVILQEQSQRPSFPDAQVAAEVYPYARALDSLIHLSSPCATTLFYVTWGRKNGDAANCPFFPPLCTYKGMDSLLQLRYTIMAKDNQAALSPVAMVWRKLREAFPAIELYDADESHPGNNGSYAAACAFYAVMFQKDPVLCTYNYTVSASHAGTIKTIAKTIAYDSLEHWSRFMESPLAAFDYTISGHTVSLNNWSKNADSYLWDFGDSHSDTAANPSHTYTAPGTYEIRLTAQKDGCEHSFTLTLTLDPTSIAAQSTDDKITVYPNPVGNHLEIQVNKSANYTITVSDIHGKRVIPSIFFQGQSYSLDTKTLAAGNYILQIQHENGERMLKKIVKE